MKRLSLVVLSLPLLLIAFSYGCKHQPAPVPIVIADSSICFERDVLPIFISNCTQSGCHNAASHEEGFQFTDYNSIVAKDFVAGNAEATELYEKITEKRSRKVMPPPPYSPLTQYEIAMIRTWINSGAENTTNCTTGSNCDTNVFTYSGAVAPIMQKYCLGCHAVNGNQSGIRLDNYNDLVQSAKNGAFLGAIKHDFGYKAMPQGGSMLPDCEIRQIEKWIAAGMQNIKR